MNFSDALRQLVYLALAYLLGAIPTGYWVGRWLKGSDIRKMGSGNMGATNVFRTLGKGPGVFVLAVDIFKGWAAVDLLARLLGISHGTWLPLMGGLVAVLGHNYTCFLNFKGGKGVATSAGVFLGLAPFSTFLCLAVFAIVVSFSRIVSVASLTAAAVLPLIVLFLNEGGQGAVAAYQPVLWLAVLLAAFVWVKHIPNIRRLMAGTENKIVWRGGQNAESGEKHG